MHKVFVDQLEPGLKLGRTLYTEKGEVLLMRGAALSERMVRAMADRGFTAVYVLDGVADDVEPQELISEHLRTAATTNVRGMFDLVSQASQEIRAHAAKAGAHVLGKELKMDLDTKKTEQHVKALYAAAESIVAEVVDQNQLIGMASLKSHDSYTFQHSVDVAVYGVMLGQRLNFEGDYLHEIAISGLLHDIGKIFVDERILQKPGKLDAMEYERVMNHPQLGFKLLRQVPLQSPRPRHVVLQHHEHQDGSGYPNGLTGTNEVYRTDRERFDSERINLMAEIVAVVDVYSALVSDRPHRDALPPKQVLQALRDASGHHLNAEMVETFLSIVPEFPVSSYVRVKGGSADGHLGIVLRCPEKEVSKPLVRLLFDKEGRRVPDGLELDMRQAGEDVELEGVADNGKGLEEYAQSTALVV